VYNQQGIVGDNNFQRINVKANIDQKINPNLNVFMNILLNQSTTKNAVSNGGMRGNSLLSAMLGTPPSLEPYEADGSYRFVNTTYPFISVGLINPVAYMNEVSSKWLAKRVSLNTGVIYKPMPDLTVNLSGNIRNTDARTDNYTSTKYPGS